MNATTASEIFKNDYEQWKQIGVEKMSIVIEELMTWVRSVPEKYRFFMMIAMFELLIDRLMLECTLDKLFIDVVPDQ